MAPTLTPGTIAIVASDEPSGSPLKSGDLVEIRSVATAESIADYMDGRNPLLAAMIRAGMIPMPDETSYFVKSADGNDPNLRPGALGWAVKESELVADPASTEAVAA